MRPISVIAGAAWFTAAYYGLGIFADASVGYYIVGIASTFGFLLVEQRI